MASSAASVVYLRQVLSVTLTSYGLGGSAIREILLHGGSLDPKSELFLYLADRAQHVSVIIKPALERGAWVLCDRHADSTVVYQGYGRGLDLDLLRQWNLFATGGLVPDVTFLLDLPAETGLGRLTSKDRLDSEPIEFHRRVRDGFLAEAALSPKRWVILDATRDPAELLSRAKSVLMERGA
jgi:dTMP kinase